MKPEQVTTEQAAKELGLTPPCLRELLIRGLIPIGMAYQREDGKRRKFVIYRGLLEDYKAKLKGGASEGV